MSVSITDFSQFAELRASADRKDPEALKQVAGQFEALFVQMMLKNMRAASFGDPLMGDNKQHELYRDMMDQQLALEMSSGRGIGLADMIVRQLGGQPETPAPAPATNSIPPVRPVMTAGATVSAAAQPEAQSADKEREVPSWSDPVSFAKTVWPHVRRSAEALNVSPAGLLAQAALETGWGEKVMQRPDGSSSLNLFGIKAHNGWQGDSVAKRTLEFDGDIARTETARFRAYEDLAQTLDDYADFIGNNPRYEKVRDTGDDVPAFAGALAEAGYATDPEYAAKIERIFSGPTMQRVLESLDDGAVY